MQHSFVKRWSAWPSVDGRTMVGRVAAVVALLAAAVWMGGLVALGAIAAPVIFSRVSFPANADAMTVVFQRFDLVVMSCAALMLASEAVRPALRVRFAPLDHARAGVSVAAAALGVFEAMKVSPRIAELHASGAVRGIGAGGVELDRWHGVAEALGKGELLLLAVVVVLHVLSLSSPRRHRA